MFKCLLHGGWIFSVSNCNQASYFMHNSLVHWPNRWGNTSRKDRRHHLTVRAICTAGMEDVYLFSSDKLVLSFLLHVKTLRFRTRNIFKALGQLYSPHQNGWVEQVCHSRSNNPSDLKIRDADHVRVSNACELHKNHENFQETDDVRHEKWTTERPSISLVLCTGNFFLHDSCEFPFHNEL